MAPFGLLYFGDRGDEMIPLYGDTGLPLLVLKSAAGYYIGREVYEEEFGCYVPYARDSAEYYQTEELAKKALDSGSFTLRSHP